jgi:hypothetical protein
MIVDSLNIPIYSGRLHIIIPADFEKDLEQLSKKYDRSLFSDRFDYIAFTTSRQNHYLFILNHKNIPKKDFEAELVNTITHECMHLCSFISKRVGLKFDVDNDEPHAYLSGWLSGEIFKSYLKFKNKHNNN